MNNNRGAVTIFFSMVLLVVISVVCVVLETARYYCASTILAMAADSAVDSVFAGYDRLLWDKYRLLLHPCPDRMAAQTEDYANDLLGCGMDSSVRNRWGIKTVNVTTENKVSVYDDGGQPFINSISDYMEYQGNDMKPETYEQPEEFIRDAMEKGKLFEELMDENKQELITWPAFSENIEYSLLSANEINPAELSSGVMSANKNELKCAEQDTKFLCQYIALFLDSFARHGSDDETLMYEQEYVLCGLPSDKENMEETIKQLIILREGINYDYICGTEDMLAAINHAAESFARQPEKAEGEETAERLIGVLWAYAEAVNDVKNILNGGRVPLAKDSESWNLDIGDVFAGNWNAECEREGFDYQEYLQLLLRLQPVQDVCIRTMDIIDSNMRLYENDFLLADCVYNACLKLEFSVKSGYISIPALKDMSAKNINEYKITKVCEGGYG